MALPNGIRVDDEGNVTFEGRSGQTLLLNALLRAKYAKPFEAITFLNEWMAELICGLHARFLAGLPPQPASSRSPLFADDPETRQDIARAILADASHTGWWAWSRDEQARFIREVACAPHTIPDETVEEVILSIQDRIVGPTACCGCGSERPHLTNLLFLCSRNRLRSPTAEQVFASRPGVETASAGLAPDANVQGLAASKRVIRSTLSIQLAATGRRQPMAWRMRA